MKEENLYEIENIQCVDRMDKKPNIQWNPSPFSETESGALQYPSPSAQFPNELFDPQGKKTARTSAENPQAKVLRSDLFYAENQPVITGSVCAVDYKPDYLITTDYAYGSGIGATNYDTGLHRFDHPVTSGYSSTAMVPTFADIKCTNLPFIPTLEPVSTGPSTSVSLSAGASEQEIIRYLKDNSDTIPATTSPKIPAVSRRLSGKGNSKKQSTVSRQSKRKEQFDSVTVGSNISSNSSRSYRWGECMTHQAIKGINYFHDYLLVNKSAWS